MGLVADWTQQNRELMNWWMNTLYIFKAVDLGINLTEDVQVHLEKILNFIERY